MRSPLLFAVLGALVLAACNGDSEGTSTGEATPPVEAASATATANPEVSATAEMTKTPPAAVTATATPVLVATVDGEYAIDDFELIVESLAFDNRFPTHRAPNRLDRVSRDEHGEIAVEILLTAEELGVAGFRHGVIVDATGQRLAVGVCEQGICGGFGPPDEEAVTAVYQSLDGGANWSRFAGIPGGVWVRGWSDGELVIWEPTLTDDVPNDADRVLRRYPSDRPIVAPPGAAVDARARFNGASGQLLWLSADGRRYLDGTGATLIDLPAPATLGGQITPTVTLLPDGLAYWSWRSGQGAAPIHAAGFDHSGNQLTPTVEVPYQCCELALDPARIVISSVRPTPAQYEAYRDELPLMSDGKPYRSTAPGILDPNTGRIEVIADPFLRTPYQDRDEVRVIAVIQDDPLALAFDPTSTGISEVDHVVEAVMAGDIDALVGLVEYEEFVCRSTDTPGYDPSCDVLGLPDGSSYEGISWGSCDVGAVRSTDLSPLLRSRFDRELAFYGVFVESERGGIPADHVVLFVQTPELQRAGFIQISLRAGRITSVRGSCGSPYPSERDVDAWIVSPADLGFPPPPTPGAPS